MKRLITLLVTIGILVHADHYVCPQRCQCTRNFRTVNCAKQKLNDIPKDIPKCVEDLILSHNVFATIVNFTFSILPNLTSLHLDNSQITSLQPHAFHGLPELRQLFLAENSIETIITEEFCADLTNLQSLYLERNHFSTLPNFGNCIQLQTLSMEGNNLSSLKFHDDYEKLTKLKQLTFSLNPIHTLRVGDFAPLRQSSVSRLLLSRIDLNNVENGTFDAMAKTLTTLKISYNPLNAESLRMILHQLVVCKKLLSLDLDGLELNSDLPGDIFGSITSLTSLSLSNNAIGTIDTGTFQNMNKLIHLDLQNSKISTIKPTALQGLTNLQRLNLEKNTIGEIPSTLPPKLNELILKRNQMPTLQDEAFVKLTQLTKLNLARNIIQKVSVQAFSGLSKLETLDLSDNSIDGIGRKTFSPIRHLKKLDLHNNKLTKIINNVHVFEELYQLVDLDLSGNDCQELPYLVFQNLTALRTLNLGSNLLKYMLANDKYGGTFAGLQNLLSLMLDKNDIDNLSPVIFAHLQNLNSLNLSNNHLTKWDPKVFTFTQNLKKLDLSRNKISVIDEFSLGKNFSTMESLNLAENPFACTCELVWLCQWLNVTKVKIVNYPNYSCDSPKQLQGVKLVNFDWRHLVCFDYYPMIIAGSVIGGVIFILFVIVLLYQCRWRINLCCYRLRTKINPSKSGYATIPGDTEYDAYISCAKNDYPFVQNVLLGKLDPNDNDDARRFTLCYEPRDFRAGESTMSNIVDAIDESQRAIIVLTNDYLRSARHQTELLYLHQTWTDRSFALIYVTYGKAISLRLLPKWLHNAYKTSEFLVWNEDEAAQEAFFKRIEKKLRQLPPLRDDTEVNA